MSANGVYPMRDFAMSKERGKKKEKPVKITKKMCSKVKRPDGLKMKFMTEYTFCNFYEVIASRFSKKVMYRIFRQDDADAITYGQFAHHVKAVSSYLLKIGIGKGDKVAIMGESCPNWMIFYVALTSIGAVAVPILPDFTQREASEILRHSESRAVMTNVKQWPKVSSYAKEAGLLVFRMDDVFHIPSSVGYPEDKEFGDAPGVGMKEAKISQGLLDQMRPEEDDLASIIYTSGTTGSSKGVMLTHKNILRCADLNTDEFVKVKPGFKVLSILPMSHVYEFTIGQILVLLQGAEVVFLGKPPAVSVLLPALKEVRPHVMLTVPLLIEKVYRNAVAPTLKENKKLASFIKKPIIGSFVYKVIGNKIMDTFGHRLKFFGIGGAPLDPEVEYFLYRAGFPYAIGYGLTETAPLVAGCGPQSSQHKPTFVGKIVKDDDVVLLDKNEEGIGEIAVKGPNVMLGYYGRPDLDKEVFTEDGYFRTGDLGLFDKAGRLAIKGRVKTMILGPAGENIYPELIENIINSQEFVQESLVVSKDGGLLALIKIDVELMSKKLKISLDDAKNEAKKYVKNMRKELNSQLSVYSRISETELQEEPFDRTPTQKIKRFLYPKKKKESENEKNDQN